MVVCTVLGITIEGLAYRPLRQATSLAVLITAIGMSYLLQNIALMIWGANPKSFPTTFINGTSLRLGKINLSSATLITILVSVVIMVALTLFTSKTKLGKAMRCVSEDRGAAELMGINVNRTISLTFAIGSALAAIAGILLCSSYPILQPTTGSMPGIKAFTAAVFGGIGSIPGVMLGGVLLGIFSKDLAQSLVHLLAGLVFYFLFDFVQDFAPDVLQEALCVCRNAGDGKDQDTDSNSFHIDRINWLSWQSSE